jgi:hypothetical protein
VCEAFTYRGSAHRLIEDELGEFLVAALLGAPGDESRWLPVISSRVAHDDDWFIAYAGCLGIWPSTPDPHMLERYRYVSGLKWTEVIDFTEEVVSAPGPADLLARLRSPGTMTPAQASTALLRLRTAPRSSSGIDSPPVLPRPHLNAEEVGPNVVVIYEPGSVEDLALLWNLRMANGLVEGLPMAIPHGADVGAALKYWQEEFAFSSWGLGSTRCALTSASIDFAEIEQMAEMAGSLWTALTPDELLRDSDRPARQSFDVATFSEGAATVAAWDSADRDAIGKRPSDFNEFEGVVRIGIHGRRIPPSPSLEPEYPFVSGFRGGGFERPGARADALVEVGWPGGWSVLEALALDRGLRVERSPAGLAAASMLERVGSLDVLGALASEGMVALLYELGERSGINWFRNKLREIGSAVDSRDRSLLERAASEIHISGSEEERGETTFSALVHRFGRSGAEAWLSWAEDRELLIRGATIRCDRCGARSWRAIDELGPRPVCRGCGRPIASPFPPGQLSFSYRAGQAVLHVMEHDALVQLFAMRWFFQLWRPFMDRPSRLFGAYPGVEFYELGGENPVGEADLLLVQTDGELVVGECKRRGPGLNPRELEKLDSLARRVGSPWSFLATLDRASACPAIWQDARRSLPESPRLTLTAESLFDDDVRDTLGADPFAWRDDSPEVHADRERKFAADLAPWLDRLSRRPNVQEVEFKERLKRQSK